MGGGEEYVRYGMSHVGAACVFEPENRLSRCDCIRCTTPIRQYQFAIWPSRGLTRMAFSTRGIVSSIDPVNNLHRPRLAIAPTQLRLIAIAVSYSGIASSYRPCARSTWALA